MDIKVNQIQAPADIASGKSLVVSAALPLQPTGHPIRELPVVTEGNTLFPLNVYNISLTPKLGQLQMMSTIPTKSSLY